MPRKRKKLKLPVWDERMIMLMQHCIGQEFCQTQREFLRGIGFSETGLKDVRNGERSFTLPQIHRAAIKYGINVNWIMGLDTQMKRKPGKTVIQQLEEAVAAARAAI